MNSIPRAAVFGLTRPHLTRSVVTAPIIGSTYLDKLKELIGKFLPPTLTVPFSLRFGYSSNLITLSTDAVDVKLSEEEIKHLEEPYKPMSILGHA